MRTRRAPPERVDAPLRWLRANNHDLAPLTGTDTRALLAIAGCWRLYFNSDDQPAVLRAVRELLHSMQPKCWHFAKALIPWAGDWSHENEVWSKLAAMDPSVVPEFLHGADRGPSRDISFEARARAAKEAAQLSTLELTHRMLMQLNERILAGTPDVPRLYEAGVKYDPHASLDVNQTVLDVLRSGRGDAEDLACWRAAELRRAGEDATVCVRKVEGHGAAALGYYLTCYVRRADGTEEDPTTLVPAVH